LAVTVGRISVVAGVMELADMLALGASVRKNVGVRVPPPALREDLLLLLDVLLLDVIDPGPSDQLGVCDQQDLVTGFQHVVR